MLKAVIILGAGPEQVDAYKTSNKKLNKNKLKKKFLINTKISIIKGNDYKAKIDSEIRIFKKNLNITKINTLLFRDRQQIFEKNIENIVNYMAKLKKKNN